MNNNKNNEICDDVSIGSGEKLDWNKFSLHIKRRENVLAIILSNSHGLQKRLASYPYEDSPSLDDLNFALHERISDISVKSLDRALKKWAGFLEVELPKILISQQRKRLVSSSEMSDSIDRLINTVRTIKKDANIYDAEYSEAFMWQLKSKLDVLQREINEHSSPKYLSASQIIEVCEKVKESISHLHKLDPKGNRDENKKLAKYMWKFWNVVRPIISGKSAWFIQESLALGRKLIEK